MGPPFNVRLTITRSAAARKRRPLQRAVGRPQDSGDPSAPLRDDPVTIDQAYAIQAAMPRERTAASSGPGFELWPRRISPVSKHREVTDGDNRQRIGSPDEHFDPANIFVRQFASHHGSTGAIQTTCIATCG